MYVCTCACRGRSRGMVVLVVVSTTAMIARLKDARVVCTVATLLLVTNSLQYIWQCGSTWSIIREMSRETTTVLCFPCSDQRFLLKCSVH